MDTAKELKYRLSFFAVFDVIIIFKRKEMKMDISTEKIAELVKRTLLEINGESTVKSQDAGIPIGISNRHIHLSKSDLEKLFGVKVYLNLWVKVKENWRESARTVSNFGYRDEE